MFVKFYSKFCKLFNSFDKSLFKFRDIPNYFFLLQSYDRLWYQVEIKHTYKNEEARKCALAQNFRTRIKIG